jgi:DMSO/TMAO reductase YedYZ heme-binding membrane subunit
MSFFADLAYGAYLGPIPMIGIIGLLTYVIILATAILASGKKWSKRLRRVPVKVHRAMGGLAIVLATLHLLMGISLYL